MLRCWRCCKMISTIYAAPGIRKRSSATEATRLIFTSLQNGFTE